VPYLCMNFTFMLMLQLVSLALELYHYNNRQETSALFKQRMKSHGASYYGITNFNNTLQAYLESFFNAAHHLLMMRSSRLTASLRGAQMVQGLAAENLINVDS
jgi:hypothetical protein